VVIASSAVLFHYSTHLIIMSTALRATGSTSWADETDEFDEQQRKMAPAPTGNRWATGNPLTGAAPTPSGSSAALKEADFPAVDSHRGGQGSSDKNTEDREYPRRGNDNREEEYPRRGGNEAYGNRREGDYPRRDNDRSYQGGDRGDRGGRGFQGERRDDSYNRGGDYPRRNDDRGDYGNRGDRGGRGFQGGDERPRRDDYRAGNRRDDGPPRERVPVPFPDQPPYTAFVGNVSFHASEDELAEFFGPDVEITAVRFTKDHTGRPKGFGYVEFADPESLRTALKLDGEIFMERNLKVDVAGGPQNRGDRGDRPQRGGREHRQWNDAQDFPDREPRNFRPQDDAPRERKRVELQPRSNAAPVEKDQIADVYKQKSNPFGDAKPSLKTVEVEEKIIKKLDDTHISDRGDARGPRPERGDRDREPREYKEPREPKENRDLREPRTDRPGFGRGGRGERPDRQDKPRDDSAPAKSWERGQGRGNTGNRGSDRPAGDRPAGNRESRGDRNNRRNPAWEHDDRTGEPPKPRPTKDSTKSEAPSSVKSTNVFDALPEDEE